MLRIRGIISTVLSLSLTASPAFAAPSTAIGTIVAAERAHVSDAAASIGATIFGGERLSTEAEGALQIRTGASRFYLSASSAATLTAEGSVASATLQRGTAVFSTLTAQGFAVRAAQAQIRPQADGPTVGQISIVGPKELLVTSRRGALAITVEDETQIVPEATSYRVILDPPAESAAQGPRGAGTKGMGRAPRPAAKNKFLLVALIVTVTVTAIAIHEALESPDRP